MKIDFMKKKKSVIVIFRMRCEVQEAKAGQVLNSSLKVPRLQRGSGEAFNSDSFDHWFHDKPSRRHHFCKSWLVSPGLLVRIPWFKKWANYPKKAPTDPGASKFNQGQYLLSRSCRIYLSFPPFFILIDCHASHKRACLKYNSYISGCFHLIWL